MLSYDNERLSYFGGTNDEDVDDAVDTCSVLVSSSPRPYIALYDDDVDGISNDTDLL